MSDGKSETMADTKDDIIATAKERFERCIEHTSRNRDKARADLRFAAASPDDPFQWDERVVRDRTMAQRPCLTINKMPQHIRQVTNDMRQNRPSVRFRAADNKADPEVAEILMGLVRHIESNSDADIAYDTASEHQVTHGEGFIRVVADYCRYDSFDQDIFIRRIKNPFRVHLDPDIQDPTGADARFAFVEDVISEEEFKAQYPDADPVDWALVSGDDWFAVDSKKIRICEYFAVEDKPATLFLWANGETSFEGDDLPQGVIKGEKPLKERKTSKCVVMWRKMTGDKVLEKREFPSRYIPIVRVVGNEWEVDGELITSGIVRNAKDSQRMYNVAQSAIVERVMQAPKAPWLAAAAAVEGYENVWQTANTANHSFLPFNHLDENGAQVPMPSRMAPATVETGLHQIAAGAADDIKSETGQYDASLGQKSNETSGRAIMARQREGDTSTYHYVDNCARAVRQIGRIILDMVPKIYDTQRVAKIVGEDGASTNATLDPNHPEALTEFRDDQGAMQRIFNPNIGEYDVVVTTGPSFTTRRVEAVQAMTQMTQANPALWQVIGDQLVKAMDWPGAEDMAERMKVVLTPEVKALVDKDTNPQAVPPQIQMAMQQMQQQMQQMGQALQEAQAAANDKQADRDVKLQEAHIRAQAEVAKAGAEIEKAKVDAQATMAAHPAMAHMMERLHGMEQVMAALGEHPALQPVAAAPIDPNRFDMAKGIRTGEPGSLHGISEV